MRILNRSLLSGILFLGQKIKGVSGSITSVKGTKLFFVNGFGGSPMNKILSGLLLLGLNYALVWMAGARGISTLLHFLVHGKVSPLFSLFVFLTFIIL